MSESNSIPGKATINHEAGDTLKRTITLSVAGVPVNLNGSTIEMIISAQEDGEALASLSVGSGLIASDPVNGQFKIYFQTEGVLQPRKTYYYKVKVTLSDGSIKTYLEDKLKTK